MPDDSLWTLSWRIFSPLFYIPWIIVAFLYTLLIAGSAFLRRFAISLTTFRGLFPFILLAVGMFFLVFQYNQDFVVTIADTVTECWDEIYTSIIKAIFDDLVRCLWPVCTLYNFVVQVIKFNMRALVNEYRCYFTCDGGETCGCTESPGPCLFPGGAFHFFETVDCCSCFKEIFVQGLQTAGIPFGDALDIMNTVIDYLDIVPPPNSPLFTNYTGLFPNPGSCDWVWEGDDTTACNTELQGKQKRAIPDFILDAFTAPDGENYSTLFFQVVCGDVLDPVFEFYGELLLWLFQFLTKMLEIGLDSAGPFFAGLGGDILSMIDDIFQNFTKEFLCMLLNWNDFGFGGMNPQECCAQLAFSGPFEFITSLFAEECLGDFGAILTCLIDNAADPLAVVDECFGAGSVTCLIEPPLFCEKNSECGENCKCEKPPLSPKGLCSVDLKKREIDSKVETVRSVYGNETAAVYRAQIFAEELEIRRRLAKNAPLRQRRKEERKLRSEESTKRFIESIQNSTLLTAFARKKHHEFLVAGNTQATQSFERYLPPEIVQENHRKFTFERDTGAQYKPGREAGLREDWTAGGKYADTSSYTMKYGAAGVYADSSGLFSGLGTLFNILTDGMHRAATAHVEHMNKRAAIMLNDHYARGGTLRDIGYHSSTTDAHLMQDGHRAIEASTSWMQDMRHVFSFVQWDPLQYDFVTPSKRDVEATLEPRNVGAKLRAMVEHGGRFVRTSNNINYPRGERPAFYIEMEVTLKTVVRRFVSPESLHILRDTLSRKGESYRLAATRIINPAIQQYETQLAKRDVARTRGLSGEKDEGRMPRPLVEPITLRSWMEWSKAAWTRKRERAAAAGTPLTPQQEREVSPEIIELSKDHMRRLRRATTPAEAWGEYHTTVTRLPQLAAVAGVVWPFIKNYKVVAGAAVPFLTSPYGQVILGRYGAFGADIFADIFHKPLDDLVTPEFLLEVGEDFALLTLDNILYLVSEMVRFLFCQWFSIVLLFIKAVAGPFLTLIPYVGAALSTIVGWLTTGGSLLTPLISYCPPEVVVVDNVPQQRPWNWFLDILDCDSTQACTTENDCAGRAPCRCSPAYGVPGADTGQPQYTTFFWGFRGDFQHPCPGDSGVCLCWPEMPCDFQLPEFSLNAPFAKDCRDFGYNIDDIIPWSYSGFGVGFCTFIQTTLENALISTRFITRTIVRGYEPFLSMDMMLLASGLFIGFAIMFGRWVWMVALIVIMFGITYGSPLLTQFTEDVLIPGLEDIAVRFPQLKSLTDFLLEFLRFENHSPVDPIGSPDPAEFTCFILNIPTLFVGASVALVIFSVLYSMWVVGLLTAIALFLAYFILLPFRIIWAVVGACMVVARAEARQRQEMQGDLYEGGGYEGGNEDSYGGGGAWYRLTLAVANSRAWSLEAWIAHNQELEKKYKNE